MRLLRLTFILRQFIPIIVATIKMASPIMPENIVTIAIIMASDRIKSIE